MPSFVDAVLKASDVIEETTLMREQMRGDEATYKRELIRWHLDSDHEKMSYRILRKVNSFAGLRKKDCKVKDYAVEVVTKMYRLHAINMKDELHNSTSIP